jgi:hypothetical protein
VTMDEINQALPLLKKAWMEMSGDPFREDFGFLINRLREYATGETPVTIAEYCNARLENDEREFLLNRTNQ